MAIVLNDFTLPPDAEDPDVPDIPGIHFEPPLQIQRQCVIQDTITAFAAEPRFAGTLSSSSSPSSELNGSSGSSGVADSTSSGDSKASDQPNGFKATRFIPPERGLRRMLDAGCGEASLIRRLLLCDDNLPFEKMSGIDLDEQITEGSIWKNLDQRDDEKENRWRELEVKLYQGSFTEVTTENIGYHDVVVASELIEHLDPEPLAQFAPVLLGRLKPKVCIVTTPNREFNALFDYLDTLQPQPTANHGFHWPGVPYRMRHHDHRFEWNRFEFRTWALEAAAKYGYDVEFTGAGGLNRCMVFDGGNDPDETLRQAIEVCRGTHPEFPHGSSTWSRVKEIVCPYDDDDDIQHDARKVFGDCSQIAVFVIKPETEATEAEQPKTAGVKLMHRHVHEAGMKEEFPPSLEAVLRKMAETRLTHLLPELIWEEWQKSEEEFLEEARDRKKHGNVFHPKEPGWGKSSWRDLDDNALRERERLYARLGGRTWEVKAVEVVVDAKTLYNMSYQLQRLCHYNYDVFLSVLEGLTADEAKPIDTETLQVEIQPQGSELMVTATFPAKQNYPIKDRWRQPSTDPVHIIDSDRYSDDGEYEEDYDVDDYNSGPYNSASYADDDFDDNYEGYHDDAHDGYNSGGEMHYDSDIEMPTEDMDREFDTVVEWVANSATALPDSKEVDGTLCLPLDEIEGGRLLRVRFFGPIRSLEKLEREDEEERERLKWENTPVHEGTYDWENNVDKSNGNNGWENGDSTETGESWS